MARKISTTCSGYVPLYCIIQESKKSGKVTVSCEKEKFLSFCVLAWIFLKYVKSKVKSVYSKNCWYEFFMVESKFKFYGRGSDSLWEKIHSP